MQRKSRKRPCRYSCEIRTKRNDGGESMSKPIIRHCQNCKYADSLSKYSKVYCDVKYEEILRHQRRKALFCRFFTPKTGDS